MRRKLMDVMYYLPLSIPIAYFGMLFVYAFVYYRSYYGGLTQVPFDLYTLLVGNILSAAALLTVYVMTGQERKALARKHHNELATAAQKMEELQTQLISVTQENQTFHSQLATAIEEKQVLQTQLTTAIRGKQALQICLEDCENQRTQERQELKQNNMNLITEFLATQKLEIIFKSDLLTQLQKGSQIEKIERLTGGYSGAQVYSFYRGKEKIMPRILKVTKKAEIENEHQKFISYVDGKLICGPRECLPYLSWGNYAALEYDLNWSQVRRDHLTFLEMYRECLYKNTHVSVKADTIEKIIEQLFQELDQSWWHPKIKDSLLNNINIALRNIYEEHYPFTRKIDEEKICDKVDVYFEWGQTNLGSIVPMWTDHYQALSRLLNIEWRRRKESNDLRYRPRVVRSIIHGDLNSRNILLEVDPRNRYGSEPIVRLVDFSHTGNGLTKDRTDKAIEDGIQLDPNQGNIANDFCRLEADIKFCLTDLDDEQDLRKAWVLECLLLKFGLKLLNWDKLNWEELKTDNKFRKILGIPDWSNYPEWAELLDRNYWTEDNSKKFIWAWQSIKAIRTSLWPLLPRRPNEESPTMGPFYLALLQANLSMIYYEDERFHNANLQKLYIVLASALLCQELP